MLVGGRGVRLSSRGPLGDHGTEINVFLCKSLCHWVLKMIDHLHDFPPDKEPLSSNTRMKIAAGAARGLEYLHDKANSPVIYRDLKSSNILLDEGYHPKLSDFVLAKLGPVADIESDVYSFGVVLLEIITGRKALVSAWPPGEQNHAQPLLKDSRKFPRMADPILHLKVDIPYEVCAKLLLSQQCACKSKLQPGL
ncbi:hypothetical protein MLD38_036118 [Melastoma candidum]|uniref:Uncharacterized protein n=1 Tax=Melastoma candidum TaxID=119954 RepID=A0ACB9LIK3_9MYRT|nr:hypothetical protein MLD38_036118 [Melastoma candidum]